MYAIVKTLEEANQLNTYIKTEYFNQVDGACFDIWTDIIPVAAGFAVEIMPEWVDRPVPAFINGIEFVSEIHKVEEIQAIVI